MTILVLLFALLIPTVGHAAYQDPTVAAKELQPDGSMKLTFLFAGNSGEPAVYRSYVVSASTTANNVRNWIYQQKASLDQIFAAASLPALAKGATVTGLAPAAPAAPTDEQIWLGKVRRLQAIKSAVDAGVTSLSPAMTTLATDVNNTYVVGYEDNF